MDERDGLWGGIISITTRWDGMNEAKLGGDVIQLSVSIKLNKAGIGVICLCPSPPWSTMSTAKLG